ncbi:MAG TPA: hypothetical protein DDZ89_21680, partial [Clostridiales bacterium]|nr:hypothetical protein [Clostridiales bacterium]
CPRCGVDIMTLYGNQPWVINPLKDPWKIQCPGCHSRFPSNDFSKFYQAGIGEDGFFHYELAKKLGQQYLKNELYPDLDENAYVDDGYGYLTGVTLPDGTQEIKPFIAYYNYFGLWGSSGGNGILVDALIALGNAYLFAGESKYGYTGAILLDRMADVYIDMDLTPYAYLPGSDGHAKRGKALGRIADYRLACTLAQSYDQLWPAYDDPKVIEFLSTKARQFHMKNPKTDGNAIRMNVDNHILREIYKAVLDGRVNGNWGYYHLSLATAAVVLDHMPETGIWIDWLFQTGTSSVYEVTGGNINAQLLEVIDRDGLGNEASFSYNNTWISTLLEIAKIFRDYDGYEKENLYHHPKIKRMFLSASDYINIGRTVPNIGDTTTALSFYIMPSAKSALIEAWRAGIWDVNIAHTLYNVNGRTVDGLRADIFTKHPEKIRDDILTMLSDKPDHKILSKNFSGFGLMMLRAGIYKQSDNTDRSTDTQRGFWIYYGRNTGHGHKDKLNLGGYAYGLDIIPDLGNPTSKTINAKRLQWDIQPLAHNTVVVNEGIKDPGHITNDKSQNPSAISTPLHFDDAGQVKVMDVQAPEVYDAAEIFRRTVVSIDVDDDSSYAVDFFRVKGGHDHIYSFHAQSNDVTIEDVPFIPQIGGTYAGVDVQSGPDPLTVTGDWSSPLRYPPGYTWLYDVKRA